MLPQTMLIVFIALKLPAFCIYWRASLRANPPSARVVAAAGAIDDDSGDEGSFASLEQLP